jgi:hypothetical protein
MRNQVLPSILGTRLLLFIYAPKFDAQVLQLRYAQKTRNRSALETQFQSCCKVAAAALILLLLTTAAGELAASCKLNKPLVVVEL